MMLWVTTQVFVTAAIYIMVFCVALMLLLSAVLGGSASSNSDTQARSCR
jgi:hypothetical protein